LVTRFWGEFICLECEWCELYRVGTKIWITRFLDILEGVMMLLWFEECSSLVCYFECEGFFECFGLYEVEFNEGVCSVFEGYWFDV
jgi:hypothetical protein